MQTEIQKPTYFLHYTEIFRACYEYTLCTFYLIKTHQKNTISQKTILIIPGLLSGDIYTFLLRKFLQKKGYNAIGWGLGINLGRKKTLEQLTLKIENLSKKQNNKIILIGWSMGGIFAREVAKSIPNSIEKIILLSAPFANLEAPNHARNVYDFFNRNEPIDLPFLAQIPKPAPIPTFALFSKTDGMVPWQVCMEKETDIHKNIEVNSSHFGMAANPNILRKIDWVLTQFSR